MMTDFLFILRWWGILFGIGIIFLPTTKLLLKSTKDSFYIFSKVIGIGIISYVSFVVSTFHILPFTTPTLIGIVLGAIVVNILILRYRQMFKKIKIPKVVIFEEILFFIALIFWSFVRSNEPSIHSLEKFMDFGFVNSILRTTYFPPRDMWFTPFSINYYFFGHLVTAVLTKLSALPSNITYNLMIATIFAFTITGAFSLVFNALSFLGARKAFLGGLLGGLLASFAGNLHTLYTLFASYTGEHPVPPWKLSFMPLSYPNSYWYPNATRFIPFTIHEFPIYSFVVSDLHGHVIDIPFVLLMFALTLTVLTQQKITRLQTVFLSLLLAIMYMTNAWDGLIYFMLSIFLFIVLYAPILSFRFRSTKKFLQKIRNKKEFLYELFLQSGMVGLLFVLFTVPFSLHFKPFVSGIGILCAPTFLTNRGHLGPFLFEANHCQHSPLYQILILYGFFFFFVISFVFYIFRQRSHVKGHLFKSSTIFILFLIILSSILILIPEFLYAKDIYPAHYRANTMFKLVYQSFLMLSLVSSFVIVYLLEKIKKKIIKRLFLLTTFVLLIFVFIYPYFAISSYYGSLKTYHSLDGTAYLKQLYLGDYEAISYFNQHVSGQPIILEAQGDSYTDYARISANTGLPTVLGWTVHEWLWRGTYDIPAPRIEEVRKLYEGNVTEALPLIKKYKVVYVVVGQLEKQKYPNLEDEKFLQIGKVVFTSSQGTTKLYKLNDSALD